MGRSESLDSVTVDAAVRGVLDQSNDLIVVIDGDGLIVLTNAAWRAAADARGADSAAAGCGVNYLGVCQRSDAAVVAAGIRAVLVGDRPRFEIEYPCHSSGEDAWYLLEVTPLEEGGGAVLTHINISASVAARQGHGHGRHFDPLTTLATSPSHVTGLAQTLSNAQLRGTSLAVVTITLPELFDFESRHGRRRRDALVVQVVARVSRFTRADDAMIRPSMNQVVLYASVADSQGAEFLRARLCEVLADPYVVGLDALDGAADVVVVSSDQFSTLNSLSNDGSNPDPEWQSPAAQAETDGADDDAIEPTGTSSGYVPLMVYSLPDGVLQAANGPARSLFGVETVHSGRSHAGSSASPAELTMSNAALAALNSGAAESFRARRTLATPDGPVELTTAVRRLLVGSGAVAVALTVPVDVDGDPSPGTEDPLAVAIVAGTIGEHGVLTSVSTANSPVETDLVAALGEIGQTLVQAAHPDDACVVDNLLTSLRLRGEAAGEFRLVDPQLGWVFWQCQLFTIKRGGGPLSKTESRVVARDTNIFVLSAVDVSAKSMVEKNARLERHIRRIGSEVLAADLKLTGLTSVSSEVAAALDELAITARQRDIVERLARGQSVATIATALFISRSTVRNHLAHVFKLTGVHSQEELLNKLRGSQI